VVSQVTDWSTRWQDFLNHRKTTPNLYTEASYTYTNRQSYSMAGNVVHDRLLRKSGFSSAFIDM